MSCNLKQTCSIEDPAALQKLLFPTDEDEGRETSDDQNEGWDEESWMDTWGDENAENSEGNGTTDQTNGDWLQKCHLGFSPTYDLMAIAHQEKLVFLSAKSDTARISRSTSSRKYKISTHVAVSEDPSSEHVTSLLCVPLVSLKRTSHGSVDWSCVILGFNTGYVKMYTETGALLISQLFHESSVLELKCRTYDMVGARRRGSTSPDQTDEVTVLYGDALVVLDGFSLFQTLRACRSQVAIAAASGGMTIEPPPMSYKKWRLTGGQNLVSCHISPGVLTPDPFDQMRTASILGGYTAEVRGSAPAMSCYVVTGSNPFSGYYYAVEGSSQPHLSHVALAVASKLKSALYSQASKWLSWGSGAQQEPTAPQKPKAKIELGTPLDIRCGLPDPLRHGNKILLAPGACLSSSALGVTTDGLGRVILMDVARAVALRMWKGYRDAQVGFMRVYDDAHRSHHRHRGHTEGGAHHESMSGPRKHALFLLLYAPRRGLLEVWTCINGPRVGAFNVSKNARLLCPGYCMLGMNSATNTGPTSHTYQCCLLEPSGQIKEVRIPFHLALSDANSKKARDMHLLKKLTLLLHSRKKTGEEAVKILLEIRLSAMLRQALEKLLHSRKLGVDTFRSCISAIQDRLKEGGALKKEDNDLLKYCEAQESLISMYEAIQKLSESGSSSHEEVVTDVEHVTNVDEMCNLLHMTRTEATEALGAVAGFRKSRHKPRVHFDKDDCPAPVFDVAEFLDCFSYHENFNNSQESLLESSSSNIQLNILDLTKSAKLAHFLFHAGLFKSTAPDDILFTLHGCAELSPRRILNLLLQHWLQQDTAITNNLANALGKLYMFIESENRKHSTQEDPASEKDTQNSGAPRSEHSSSLWEWVREDICAPSHNSVAAYFLAVVSRAVAISTTSRLAKDEKEDADDSEGWEKMQVQEGEEASEAPPPSYDDSCTGEKALKHKGGEWETLWIDTEKWNLFVRQLEDCLLVNTAINLGRTKPSTPELKEESTSCDSSTADKNKGESTHKVIESDERMDEVSVKDLLSNGPGFLAELVSHAICQLKIDPDMLKQQNYEEEKMSSKLQDRQKRFLDFLHCTLYPRFPYSLSQDTLHAHSFWELIVKWNKEPMEVKELETAVTHLQLVRQDPHARHGLAVMAWKTFVSKRYLALAKLIDKVGKAPKDRLCRKDVGISDTLMPMFCQACTDILQTIADADLDMVPQADEGELADMSRGTEDAWQGVTGRRSIVDMGRAHSHAHYGLVQHNMHLCFVLHATMQFSLRGVKPLTALFDKRGKSCFVMDLTTKDRALPNPDSIDLSINKARQQFLTKLVSAAVQRIASQIFESKEKSPSESDPVSEQECKDELERWIETSVHMASEFQIDVEKIKMHHINELFRNGLDAIGHEACTTVSDKEVLSSSLILTVGQRLSYLLLHARPDDGVVMLSRMPPTLSTWIKSQDSSALKKPDVPIADTLSLARLVLTMMSENHSQYNIALFLEEAASAIMSP